MQTVSHSVAKSRDIAGNIAFIQRASRKPQTAAQRAVAPLSPVFEACKSRGLVINDANREIRIRAVNRYLDFLPFDWIEASFKELLLDQAAIFVVADAIQAGALKW
jgi:hypothetical protein